MLRTLASALVLFFTAAGVVSMSPAALAQSTAAATNEAAEQAVKTCARDGTDKIASYTLTEGKAIAQAIGASLTGGKGSALAGRDLMVSPDRGNCTACHAVTEIRKKARTADSTSVTRFGLQGTVAKPLDGIATRFTEGELRLIIVNPQIAFPKADSIMPAYHHVEERKRVKVGCDGRAILTAGEVEDIITYLLTLTDEAK